MMRAFRTVCIVLLCLALCACGRKTAESDSPTAAEPTESVTLPQSEPQPSVQAEDAALSQADLQFAPQTETPDARTEGVSYAQTTAAASAPSFASTAAIRTETSSALQRTTAAQAQRQTTRSAAAEAQTKLRQSVNESYGQTQQSGESGTTADLSADYRTSDSYAFEQDALSAARAMVAQTLASPESLTVSETRVTDCADDGDNVYYRIFMRAAYRVQTGEQIRRSVFQSVGIHKKDGRSFDASDTIRDVLQAYSIYAPDARKTKVDCDPDSPDYALAAQKIALAQLKDPAAGVFRSCMPLTDAPDPETGYVVYDAVCVGMNDYGMQIPGAYTVYMVLEDGAIRQVDPTDA